MDPPGRAARTVWFGLALLRPGSGVPSLPSLPSRAGLLRGAAAVGPAQPLCCTADPLCGESNLLRSMCSAGPTVGLVRAGAS